MTTTGSATTLVPSTDDSVPTDDTLDGESVARATSRSRPIPREACYGEGDAAAASACFAELVAAGDIEASEVPIFLRYPECGAAELGWSGDYYSLSDAEFVAAVEAAAPCFQALVDSGEIGGLRGPRRDRPPGVPRRPQLVHRPTRRRRTPSAFERRCAFERSERCGWARPG